ncbi:GTP-binding protein [Acinetobacter portensis]|uniref:GTP-binding protein n=3 Tax=Acinetobacter TaxID=469 RepID=A0A6L6GFD3_9GAMM|nr:MULTISPECIES: GTP-binding protein [Acinetobacter]MCK7608307.1 GTP-binding protein [Acinetobacter portensis]MCK7639067.1 GTP-binding protein [Acinetobacter portensis]MDY6456617.1 GTP-binding protein [Acinetobacter faecalis]MDY6460409.1 GTP-binding protein [Acinetobacter faecalis]MDY6537435.1 GTP-binding protein [Acinetobacter faecalis]
MKLIAPIKAIPIHIISGFLGAGKTTVLQHLLSQKPEHEIWAVLMNEFGQIGIDQQLMPQSNGFAIQELLGGCLCCSSQLPMQIALSRLISENKIDRLFIEPTGLGHPAQLLEQLTEPHWLQHLSMRSLVTVIDGSRLHDSDWSQQNLYQDQLKAAQVVVISHQDKMTDGDIFALETLKKEYEAYQQKWILTSQGKISILDIDQIYIGTKRLIQPLLKIQKNLTANEQPVIKQLPYHYVESAQGYSVAGWKLPKSWTFNFYDVLDLLCEQKDWLRIKAVFNTNEGWKSFNFNPNQFNYQTAQEGIDNRIEIIYQNEREWLNFEEQLFQCRIDLSE